ncbi:unnamed protein product [Phyllotreta striolata]|uniref:Small ribosomal subunit protein bS16m n=1 Tax=Phyllotreta striolata TaxID=444603 RepID=A0A9N9XR75_PHYSR|nr:unnamed protein product [Phyllotreta striolata]
MNKLRGVARCGLPFPPPTKIIRFQRQGCTNRPFYHIIVADVKSDIHFPPIEQLGTHDPIANENNEKLTSLNYERIRYWLSQGATTSRPVQELLGLAGFFPIHPRSYMTAWRNRKLAEETSKIETTGTNEQEKE